MFFFFLEGGGGKFFWLTFICFLHAQLAKQSWCNLYFHNLLINFNFFSFPHFVCFWQNQLFNKIHVCNFLMYIYGLFFYDLLIKLACFSWLLKKCFSQFFDEISSLEKVNKEFFFVSWINEILLNFFLIIHMLCFGANLRKKSVSAQICAAIVFLYTCEQNV